MSNKQREALEAARDFLVNVVFDGDLLDKINNALAEPVQEPVAWLVGAKQWVYFDKTRAEYEAKFSGELAQPLYTSPQPREWQELSEDEISAMYRESGSEFLNVFEDDVSIISAALRAKNEVNV